MHRCGRRGGLYVQIMTMDGEHISHPLETDDASVARSRIVPFIKQMIDKGRLNPASRAARIYIEKKQCPACGQYLK